MKTPSVKNLIASFPSLTPAQAGLIKRLGSAADRADDIRDIVDSECPSTAAYARQCYNDPFDSYMWRVTMALHAMDTILGTHGVEALDSDATDEPGAFEYLNMGDPYILTLIYRRSSDTLSIGSWGDIAERMSG